MKKVLSFIMVIALMFTAVLPCVYAADETSVSQVEELLKGIDTLQQMQNKRSTYTVKNAHYDINTTKNAVITEHNNARAGYESYVSDMFNKRAAAQQAYDALSDEEKAQVNPTLVSKLSNELPTVFKTGECSVTPADDEYVFETPKLGLGFGYEVSNHMISGNIPQTFVLVDTSDGATTWSPDGKYTYGKNNYILAYCCDVETGLEYSHDYKQVNLEDSNYFDETESKYIRAVIENSYPFITMEEMKNRMKYDGIDEEFVDSLTRADMIAGTQMAVWSHANINDAAADGLEYFASINTIKNTGIYFTPLHDYTNEVWDWLPGKRQRSFDTRAQYRVNTLGEYLCNLEPVTARKEQIVISAIEVTRTELLSEDHGVYEIEIEVSLNGGGDKRDDLNISATSYSEKDGTVTVTDKATQKAVRQRGRYKIDVAVKDGDKIKIEVDGRQYLAKGVYFYNPKGGRHESQSLVGMNEGYTSIKAEGETLFTAPEYTIEAPDSFIIKDGEKLKIDIHVVPAVGAPDIKFSSSNEKLATVDKDGYITAVGTGEVIIKAELPNGQFVTVPVTVKSATGKTHAVVFGKTEKIGWYSVSKDGGQTFQTVFGNSNLVIEDGTLLTVKAVDVFGDPFTFYINGDATKPDENGYVTFKVDGYMLIGALGIPVIAPDADESLTWIQKIWKSIVDFFNMIAGWFKR